MNASGNEAITMDNSGRVPLHVPGFDGIPVDFQLKCEDRFAHGVDEWQQVPAVTARELAMVGVMNIVTDKFQWNVDIFDKGIVADWREEAFASTPLMSEQAWNWCLAELRDKAVLFSKDQYVRVLDTGSCICKSDVLVPETLGGELRSGLAPLLEQPDKDWQPGTDEQVLNLVDPSLFPLVYGKSLVLTDGGQVDLDDVLSSYDKRPKVAPKHFDKRIGSHEVQTEIERGARETSHITFDRYNSKLEFYYWSSNYQSLPCEVQFLKDSGTKVHINSYINNLHPGHKSLYQSIERLVSLAIKPWNSCLIQGQPDWEKDFNQGQRGPVPLRIITYGIEWENEFPEWALAFNIPLPERIQRYRDEQKVLRDIPESATGDLKKAREKAQKRIDGMGDVEGKLDMKEPTPELWKLAKEYLELPDHGSTIPGKVPEDWRDGYRRAWIYMLQKHEKLLKHKHPEPGKSFSYEDWKARKNINRAVVDIVTERPEWTEWGRPRPVIPDYQAYQVALQDTFRKQGLQIIVQIDGIELTPEKPKYSGGNWKLEGQLNEHIVATATYIYDAQNVTKPHISFRQETPIGAEFYQYATHRFAKEKDDPWYPPPHRVGKRQTEIAVLAEILGFQEDDIRGDIDGERILPFQNIGSIAMPQGRLITFPNVIEHRIEPFELLDPNLPGHHRCVKLHLVDPHYRVCSTRNVPPQQHNMLAHAVRDELMKLHVPREISAEVMRRTDDWPMGIEEARKNRLEMLKEKRWMDMARYNWMPRYGFSS